MFTRIAGLLSVILGLVLAQGCIIIPLGSIGDSTSYQEVQLKRGNAWDKILVLDVSGAINGGGAREGLFSSDSTVVEVAEKLQKARRDRNIRAVVLRVDSPGGGVTASDIIYHELKKYREDTDVPVYVSMQDLAASGGYYIAMAADEIYAHQTTITGSIGVIAMFPELKGLGDKIGVSMNVIKSGENKDIGAPWKTMAPEQREILQSIIDDMYNKFVAIVHENRKAHGLDEATVRQLADGRIYTAQQALDAKLIDGIKSLDEVIQHAKDENDARRGRVVIYRKTSRTSYDSVYAHVPDEVSPNAAASTTNHIGTQVNILSPQGLPTAGQHGPVFQYLWVP